MVTVTRVKGSAPREEGAKMIVLMDGKFYGTIGGGNLEQQALEDAQRALREDKTRAVEYKLCDATGQCCGGVVEMLIEVLNTNPQVYIFGAGHVGQALARTLVGTPFAIHLIDDRDEWIQSDKIPTAVTRHPCHWKEFVKNAIWNGEKTYAVVMTCSHPIDQEIISEITRLPAKYLGLIGSKNKWLDFQLHLGRRGSTREELQRVHCPIGVKSGGNAPQEIAISIAQELIKIYYESNINNVSRIHPTRTESDPIGRVAGRPAVGG